MKTLGNFIAGCACMACIIKVDWLIYSRSCLHESHRVDSYIIIVKPPNKGHVGDDINSAVLSFIERLSSFRGSQCIKTIGHVIFGTLNSVLCREVYYTVSLFQRVHYWRFHCVYYSSYAPVNVIPEYPLCGDTGGFDIYSNQISHHRGNLFGSNPC